MMSELQAYLALASYPAICLLVGNWWSAGARWASEHRSFSIPPEMADKEEASGRVLLPFKYLLELLLLRAIAGTEFWRIPNAGLRHEWPLLVLWGLAGGFSIFAFRRLSARAFRSLEAADATDHLLRGPRTLWFAILVVGGLSAEVWRALTISALRQNDFAFFSANLLTGFAFAFAHMCGRPSRIPAGLDVAGIEVLIGLMFGGLFLWSGNLVVPILANATYYISNFLWLREHYHPVRDRECSSDDFAA